MRRFAGIALITDRIPDETTILAFRHLLEKHDLGEGCVPFRGVKAEARMPWSEGEQSRVTGCHSGGADAPHSSTMNQDD
jgi:hypothetical protein